MHAGGVPSKGQDGSNSKTPLARAFPSGDPFLSGPTWGGRQKDRADFRTTTPAEAILPSPAARSKPRVASNSHGDGFYNPHSAPVTSDKSPLRFVSGRVQDFTPLRSPASPPSRQSPGSFWHPRQHVARQWRPPAPTVCPLPDPRRVSTRTALSDSRSLEFIPPRARNGAWRLDSSTQGAHH